MVEQVIILNHELYRIYKMYALAIFRLSIELQKRTKAHVFEFFYNFVIQLIHYKKNIKQICWLKSYFLL